MSSVPPNADPISFDNCLEREKQRQQRHAQGGHHLDLAERLPVDANGRDECDVPARKQTRPSKPPPSKRRKQAPAPPPPPPPPTPSPPPPSPKDIQQLIAQLPSYEEEVLEQDASHDAGYDTCPFHKTPLHFFDSKLGYPYVKCSTQPCSFFTSQFDLKPHMNAIRDQLHPALKFSKRGQGPYPDHECWCKEPLALRTSRSEKNPGRLFLSCKQRHCDFFQWLNANWTRFILERIEHDTYTGHSTRHPMWFDGKPYVPMTADQLQCYKEARVLTG